MLGTVCSSSKLIDSLEFLKKVARKSDVINKHSACVLKNGKILAYGVNKYFQIKVSDQKFHIGVHAEMDAVSSCSFKYTKGADVLVIRVNKTNNLQYSRPCSVCIEKLQQKGIRKAYYSDNNGQIVYEFVDEMPKIHTSAGCRIRNRF